MSRLYGAKHRALQEKFESMNMADRIEDIAVVTEISDESAFFIEQRDMFFLSSVDHQGRPTVSYKGGDAGNFVKVTGQKTLAFPLYDGNGMYFSAGNIDGNPEVGLLFIDFEKPHRIRIQGKATVSEEKSLTSLWKEAELVVQVTVSELWQNCPRYIHRYQKIKDSRYVPQTDCETPIAGWKRVHEVSDVIKDSERQKVKKAGGPLSIDDWMKYVQSGDEKA